MNEIIYLRMKKNVEVDQLKMIKLKHIAYISTSSNKKRELEETDIYQITKKDNDTIVIDSFLIVDHLNKLYEALEFQIIGPAHSIIRIKEHKKKPSIILTIFVWILIFIGTGMTIMNFHYDVSMQEVQQKLHYLFTGEKNKYPLWIQIPYSIGLGIGMILFLNHWFKKKINEEPSPLEVEIFNYQQNLDQYITHHENELNDTKHLD